MKIEINPEVLKEFEYIVKLHATYDAPNKVESVEELVSFVLASVADGSRRPGAWERELLHLMGLAAECQEHQTYRSSYGEPE